MALHRIVVVVSPEMLTDRFQHRDEFLAYGDSSTLIVFPGAGHACNIEAGDEFNRAVREFLRDCRV